MTDINYQSGDWESSDIERNGMTTTTSSRWDELDAISADLDRAGQAWVGAGYPYDGPTFEAREAVFARLRTWNAKYA